MLKSSDKVQNNNIVLIKNNAATTVGLFTDTNH